MLPSLAPRLKILPRLDLLLLPRPILMIQERVRGRVKEVARVDMMVVMMLQSHEPKQRTLRPTPRRVPRRDQKTTQSPSPQRNPSSHINPAKPSMPTAPKAAAKTAPATTPPSTSPSSTKATSKPSPPKPAPSTTNSARV
ncbi:hypothetical protein HZ326_27018 [Fusarium oxysporum f. sp. albedinis]|nr:hypothetical protein HZ326_27018 [Fusarium oxysporum f. sp. albedinis]